MKSCPGELSARRGVSVALGSGQLGVANMPATFTQGALIALVTTRAKK